MYITPDDFNEELKDLYITKTYNNVGDWVKDQHKDPMKGFYIKTPKEIKAEKIKKGLKIMSLCLLISAAAWFFSQYKITIKEDVFPYEHTTFVNTDKYIAIEKR